MKTAFSAVMVAASLSLGMAAAQATPQPSSQASTVTRAEVLNELHQAQAQGLISEGELGYPVEVAPTSEKSYAEVQSELLAAFDAGQINEYGMNFAPRVATSTKTRAQVVASLHQYKATHGSEFIEH
ncbi:DUF4148 domain-containing protein [Allopusillimonas ginsengisoli]|uniref:DUF4148 domain-containing protein n=1 Tax=Allopusillimonas ginsengisoli TaxID=453575 RepID=UPI0010C17E34|nr:DUF4148 domain-containing protein [Allopusillimonas ginsengisoli]